MTPNLATIFGALDLRSRRRIVVALSGGSDSTALLILLLDHLRATGAADRLLAVTVDHGLRAGSAGEAVAVAELCRRLGVEHRTLRWEGVKPTTGIIAAAREARYDLLARAADDAGTDLVLTGHTADDQAETVAMRALRGPGSGLAGMATATLFDGRVWIVRPLLDQQRHALRAMLSARGIAWIDEPSNDNPAFERVRVRAALGDDEAEALVATARGEGERRRRLARDAAAFVAARLSRPVPGLFRLDCPGAGAHVETGLDDAPALLALRSVLACAGGMARLPDSDRTLALLRRLSGGERLRVSLSRTIVDARQGGVWIRREARALPTLPVVPGGLTWDGRWRIRSTRQGQRLVVGPVGAGGAESAPPYAENVPTSLVRAAQAAEPGLFCDDGLVGPLRFAGTHGVEAVPLVAPYARFLPGFDLPLAAALGRVVGAPELPAPPWKDHIAPGP